MRISEMVVERVAGRVMASDKIIDKYFVFNKKAFYFELLRSLSKSVNGTFSGDVISVNGAFWNYQISFRDPVFDRDKILLFYMFGLVNTLDGISEDEAEGTLRIPLNFRMDQVVVLISRNFTTVVRRWGG